MIALLSWTPDGMLGALFKLMGSYAPPPPPGTDDDARFEMEYLIAVGARS